MDKIVASEEGIWVTRIAMGCGMTIAGAGE